MARRLHSAKPKPGPFQARDTYPSANDPKTEVVMLKRYSELGQVHRGEPCQEYPGEWLVYYKSPDENIEVSKGSFDEAYDVLVKFLVKYDADVREYPLQLSICWKCSDNDPRIGQVWFTGFYQHGKCNQFGSYIS